MGVIISVSIPEDVYDMIRATEEANPRVKRSGVIALMLRNGYARLLELQEQKQEGEKKE